MASSVQDIFNSLYSAVVTAQKNVEGNHIAKIRDDYFDEEGAPKMVALVLSGKKVEVPLFTLVQQAVGDLGKRRESKMAQVKIKFTGTDKPEGLARIGDNLTKLIPTI